MEPITARKEMTADYSKGIVDLPNYFDNQPVEITISPVETYSSKKLRSEAE